MHAVWFELAIPASERPQTYALARAATGMGSLVQQAVGMEGGWHWFTIVSRDQL
jgi:hypothetical protein